MRPLPVAVLASVLLISSAGLHAQTPLTTDPATLQRMEVLQGYVEKRLAALEEKLAEPTPIPDSRDLPYAALAELMLHHDAAKAQAILDHLFALQSLDPATPAYGKFPWQENHPEISDDNAVEFTSLAFAPIFERYGDAFPPEFVKKAEPHLHAALVAIDRHKVLVDYTNIFLMKLSNQILIGEYLGDRETVAKGTAALDQWLDSTRQTGIREYGTGTYNGVDAGVLNTLYSHVKDPAIKARAKAALDLLFGDVFANYFAPWESLSGPSSRTYNFLGPDSGIENWYYFYGLRQAAPGLHSILEEQVMFWANGLWNAYVPDAALLALARTPEKVVRQQWGLAPASGDASAIPLANFSSGEDAGHDRYNYVTPDFALGSSSHFYWLQDRNLVLFPAAPGKPQVALSVVPDPLDAPYGRIALTEKGGHKKILHLKYALSAVQEKGSLLALLDLGPGLNPMPDSVSTAIVFPLEADALLLDGKPVAWPADGTIPCTDKSLIVLRQGKMAAAFRIFHADPFPGGETAFALKNDGAEFHAGRLVAYHSLPRKEGTPAPAAPKAVRSGILLLAASCATDAEFEAFQARAAKWTIEETTDGDLWKATASGPAEKGPLTLGASLNEKTETTGPRTVNGQPLQTTVMEVNGEDWMKRLETLGH